MVFKAKKKTFLPKTEDFKTKNLIITSAKLQVFDTPNNLQNQQTYFNKKSFLKKKLHSCEQHRT